jgi:hypothetical protein
MASGAVHLTGILPPRVVYAPSTADSEISLKLVRFSEFFRIYSEEQKFRLKSELD